MAMIITMMTSLLSGIKDIKKRKVQKAKIKEELLPIAWYPSRHWNWYMSEEKKKETEIFFLST